MENNQQSPANTPAASSPEGSKEDEKSFDTIIEKWIGKMWGGLGMASIQHFIETGKINGTFRENLTLMLSEFLIDYDSDTDKEWQKHYEERSTGLYSLEQVEWFIKNAPHPSSLETPSMFIAKALIDPLFPPSFAPSHSGNSEEFFDHIRMAYDSGFVDGMNGKRDEDEKYLGEQLKLLQSPVPAGDKQDVVEFAEWIEDNGFKRTYPRGTKEALWFLMGYNPKFKKEQVTTQQLYTLFLQSKNI